MYYRGEGVENVDLLLAHMWSNIAASSGYEVGAEIRGMVATHLSPADISKTQDLARECVRKNYKGC